MALPTEERDRLAVAANGGRPIAVDGDDAEADEYAADVREDPDFPDWEMGGEG